MVIDKSLYSNSLALLLVAVGLLLSGPWQIYVLNTGLFALSGGITNWLAVHMLFERIPGLYGSGVIQIRFEDFKSGIRNLIMDQFFRRGNLDTFFKGAGDTTAMLAEQLQSGVDDLDLDQAFESLLQVIMNSPFAATLGLLGGRDALNSLKGPFVEKMREYFHQQFTEAGFQQRIQQAMQGVLDEEDIHFRVQELIDRRLDQMTPAMVKDIVQQMIRQHLGWLVVWGCAFGGVLGLLVTVAANL